MKKLFFNEDNSFSVESFKFFIWILCLTGLAGALNVYAVKVLGMPLTHHTGNASALAIALHRGDGYIRLASVIVCFFLGSFCAGLLLSQRRFVYNVRYAVSLLAIGVVLTVAQFFAGEVLQRYLLVFAIGLQNGLFLIYDGALVRTSHITGYLTDAGYSLGLFFCGEKDKLYRSIFFIVSVMSFILGGVLSSMIIEFTANPLCVFGAMYVCAGSLFVRFKNFEIF